MGDTRDQREEGFERESHVKARLGLGHGGIHKHSDLLLNLSLNSHDFLNFLCTLRWGEELKTWI